MSAEPLAQVRAQAVIDRAAVGEVGIHVAEGYAVRECCWIAICVESLSLKAL